MTMGAALPASPSNCLPNAFRESELAGTLPWRGAAMAGDIVYADIHVPAESLTAHQAPATASHDLHPPPSQCRLLLKLSLAGNFLLALVVTVLSMKVLQGPSQEAAGDTTPSTVSGSGSIAWGLSGHGCSPGLEDLVSRLQRSLCGPNQLRSSGGTSCRLCPMNWLQHNGKCYWFSQEAQSWHESHKDCAAKNSEMLVAPHLDEMELVHNVTQGQYPVWIGVRVVSPMEEWVWVNGSTLDQDLFPLPGPADGNSCGMLKGDQTKSEVCTAEFKWVCWKESIPL
ncbi:killer cell lectin-like receptor subfamily B member 1B allele C isoform X2 [Alligator sinensis]|nr:killer cell lectin-like receptor subfamily B member 1B allele C isoform X2 [Alligator sinensis]